MWRLSASSRWLRRSSFAGIAVSVLILGFGTQSSSYNNLSSMASGSLSHLAKGGLSQFRDTLQFALPATSVQEEQGTVFFVHSADQAKDLYDPLCVVAQQRARHASSQGTRADRLPIALQDVAVVHSSAHLKPIVQGVLDAVADDGACFPAATAGPAPSPASKAPRRDFVKSIAVLPASRALPRRPLLAISIQGDPLHAALASSMDEGAKKQSASSTVWICMPPEDLASSAWILTLPLEAVQAWHTPIWKLIVITNDRVVSLRRLLKSLRTAHYYGDPIDLHFKADAFADDDTTREIDQFANRYAPSAWTHGATHINHRFRQAGLITNIVEAWYPAGDHEYAFFFEDDIEASPYFFAWAKYAILMYRYGPDRATKRARDLYGVSLYQAKTSELDPDTGRVLWNATTLLQQEAARPGGHQYDENSPFLFQVPCSWGAVYFPQHWREFHLYLRQRERAHLLPEEFKVVWPKVVSNGWRESWKRYLIELAFMRGYQKLYPNYPNFTSLSTNHVELGQHIDNVKQANLKPLQFLPLMQDNEVLRDLPEGQLPALGALPAFDLWGRMTDDQTVYALGWDRQKDMFLCQRLLSADQLAVGRPLSDYNATSLLGCLDRPLSPAHNATTWRRFEQAKWGTVLEAPAR